LALSVFETSAFYLGRGLALLIDLLNPEVIVIGSIYARAEPL
jgi:glucokinase